VRSLLRGVAMWSGGLLALSLAATPVWKYTRVLTIDNSSFLDAVDFFDGDDPTHGYVNYLNREDALSAGLVKLSNGQIVMSAEQTDTASARRSVRVHSRAVFTQAIFIIDVEHVPTGCGTWPAWWTCGPDWPLGGEIDVLEGTHRQTRDMTTLHTSAGCDMRHVDPASFSGTWAKALDGRTNATDCFVGDPKQVSNAGCQIIDDDASSFGEPFNARGGGVVATVWDQHGMRMYRWSRKMIPSNMRESPNESSWGIPYARYEFGDACPASHFHDHQAIFDLTLCGDWAGATFAAQCSGVAGGASCEEFVSRGANMAQAFWTVNYVDVWQAGPDAARSLTLARPAEQFHGTGARTTHLPMFSA
jgi:hypothetical protein